MANVQRSLGSVVRRKDGYDYGDGRLCSLGNTNQETILDKPSLSSTAIGERSRARFEIAPAAVRYGFAEESGEEVCNRGRSGSDCYHEQCGEAGLTGPSMGVQEQQSAPGWEQQ